MIHPVYFVLSKTINISQKMKKKGILATVLSHRQSTLKAKELPENDNAFCSRVW